jgi:serine/threonine protein kinase
MPESQKCPRCGAEVSPSAPGGHCLRCALELALSGDDDPTPSADVPVPPKPAAPGDRIGRYRLIEQIGKGGFGVVFKAEQEEPIRRFVALKVIKRGMDSEQVIARFEAERQALALMDHPNIAKVLDAGADAAGRPFFVMELVPGPKITDYCDAHKLSLRQRLDLFIQVCQAIQHAHQKGVIHRDIKPSNVLVSEADGVPVPKVIDFGIAKAAQGQRLTEETVSTAFAQFLGTPAYMSPEQAGLRGQDIDARSDIYSLGMLLYELLTAQPAFDAKTLGKAAMDEILRFIREKEPPRPSARLTTLTPAELETVAQCRQVEPANLPRLLRGDLDWIVMRAVEKDRARRYETANGLAQDIQRYLDHEPVLARPPSRVYRLQKVIRRNRLAFAAAGIVLAALIIGLGLSTWLYSRERAAVKRAVAAEAVAKKSAVEIAMADDYIEFHKQLLKGVGPAVARGRDTRLLREILDKTSERLRKDLTARPEEEAELRSTLGGVYAEVGDYGAAEKMHSAALALRRQSNPESQKVADSLNDLANVFYRQGKLTNAETMHREALAMRKKLLGQKHAQVAESLSNLANVLREQGRLREAEAMFREALAMRRELLGNNHADTARSLDNLAGVLSLEG